MGTMNIAIYAIAGAVAFALVGGIGYFLMSSVVKNLRTKPLEQDELAEEEALEEILKEETLKEVKVNKVKEQPVKEQAVKVKPATPSSKVQQEPVKHYKELVLSKVADTSVVESVSLRLEDRLTIGRTKEKNDWALPEDHTVSSKHCQLYIQNERVYLMDLNSTNGTYVNGVRLTTPVAIKNGDKIKLGMAEYKIFIQ